MHGLSEIKDEEYNRIQDYNIENEEFKTAISWNNYIQQMKMKVKLLSNHYTYQWTKTAYKAYLFMRVFNLYLESP